MLILELVSQQPDGLSNKQISEKLGIATSSCSYVLGKLEQDGYLVRNSKTGQYEIGLKVVAIARGALRNLKFRKFAAPVLQHLATETGWMW